MGIDPISIALIGMSVASAANTMKNAKSQTKAISRNAELEAKNKATQTAAKAAYQKTSFLSSGFTLEGTPMAVLDSTFTTGKQDINQIIGNANMQSKNIMSQARSSALKTLADSTALQSLGGNMMDTASAGIAKAMPNSMLSYMPDSFLYSANLGGAGIDTYSAFDLKDMRY